MTRMKYTAGPVFACLALLSAPATAKLLVATYSGNLSSGVDAAGIFGLVGADLAGADFSVAFVYDFSRQPIAILNPAWSMWHSVVPTAPDRSFRIASLSAGNLTTANLVP